MFYEVGRLCFGLDNLMLMGMYYVYFVIFEIDGVDVGYLFFFGGMERWFEYWLVVRN